MGQIPPPPPRRSSQEQWPDPPKGFGKLFGRDVEIDHRNMRVTFIDENDEEQTMTLYDFHKKYKSPEFVQGENVSVLSGHGCFAQGLGATANSNYDLVMDGYKTLKPVYGESTVPIAREYSNPVLPTEEKFSQDDNVISPTNSSWANTLIKTKTHIQSGREKTYIKSYKHK